MPRPASYIPALNSIALTLRNRITLVLATYCIFSAVFGLSLTYNWHVAVTIVFGVLMAIEIFIISLIKCV